MNCFKSVLLFFVLFSVFSAVSTVDAAYMANVDTFGNVLCSNAHIVVDMNGGDKNWNYVIDAEVMNDEDNWHRIDSGSGELNKNVPVPVTITKLSVYFTGETHYSFFGDHVAWWKNQRAVIYLDNHFPDPNYRGIDVNIKISSDHKRCNYNHPYIEIDGNKGAFNRGGAWGWGWSWSPSFW